jgi:hypothetical protein
VLYQFYPSCSRPMMMMECLDRHNFASERSSMTMVDDDTALFVDDLG